MPRPLLATSGYERVYDGEIYCWSPASTRLALGPGRAVLILGSIFRVEVEAAPGAVAVIVLVVMESSAAAVSSQPPVVCE